MSADLPEVSRSGVVRARKNWECMDCRVMIPKGTEYYSTSGKWSGEWSTHRICLTCNVLRNSLGAWGEDGAPFGALQEFVAETVDLDADEEAHRWDIRWDAIREWATFVSGRKRVAKYAENQLKEQEAFAAIRTMPQYDVIPDRFIWAYIRWVLDGQAAGHFIMATLENNLQKSFAHADEDAQKALPAIAKLLYNRLPFDCQGSKEAVNAWKGLPEGYGWTP